jgi:hypothetical protein
MEKKEQGQKSQVRKPFQKPRLRIYGRISALTQATSRGKFFDGAPHKQPHKTGG